MRVHAAARPAAGGWRERERAGETQGRRPGNSGVEPGRRCWSSFTLLALMTERERVGKRDRNRVRERGSERESESESEGARERGRERGRGREAVREQGGERGREGRWEGRRERPGDPGFQPMQVERGQHQLHVPRLLAHHVHQRLRHGRPDRLLVARPPAARTSPCCTHVPLLHARPPAARTPPCCTHAALLHTPPLLHARPPTARTPP